MVIVKYTKKLLLLVAAVGAFASPGFAEDEKITLNFVNADIDSVVKAIGEITGKNFLIDPRVKGTINIVSSKPVSRALTYPILLSALRLQGFAAVESNGVTKIVPEADAKLHFSPLADARTHASGDQMVTQVYTLKYESASQLIPILRPLISPNNTIAAYPANNTLVITDYADNVRRIGKIIDAIDQPSLDEPVVIKLKHASALDLAQTITRLMGNANAPAAAQLQPGTAPDGGNRLSVVADARTNSLLVRSDNPSRLARVQALVASLDSATSAAGNIHVIYLKNADATKVAQTLRAVMGESTSTATATATAAQTQTAGAQAVVNTAATAGGGMINADAATNALIITAPDAIYNNLRAVVDQLDMRRAQVFVEALIAEVTADRAAEFGIQWQGLSGANRNDPALVGGTNLSARGQGGNIIDAAANLGTLGRGLNIGVVKGKVTIPGVGEILNLGVLVRALETDAKTNILSTPNLLTLDNEEAKIVIGQNVPFITGQYALTGSSATPTPFQTIERRDVGLTLKIRPQISEGGSVKLQIYQEVSSVQDKTNPAGVITNKRSLESTVLVDDGQIVALGGLMQDTANDNVDKVPGLGDLPGVGHLFRFENRSRQKTNLMVFLRPVVLRDAAAGEQVTSGRYDSMRNEQILAQPKPHFALPDLGAPQLPPAGQDSAPPAR